MPVGYRRLPALAGHRCHMPDQPRDGRLPRAADGQRRDKATVIAATATATFGIFVTGTGNVAFDPATNRILRPFHGRERPSRGDQRGGADAVKSRTLCC
jgi:hypothetical protein